MAQPPPRKGAYNKFVINLHKEQFIKLQAKNQQELDLLDDIRNFMKQRAAIEKHYAEGLLKLSNVYSSKKIATVEDLPQENRVSEHEHNIYQIWRIVLDENEKISKARLAAVQVFQEKISDDAKNVRYGKNMLAKRSLDRLQSVQRDVQGTVAEVDRTKRIYFSEESDALEVATKAQDAELKAKGKKRDVKSLFQSKSALKKQAVKMSAKQDESDIKSTGARNDYMLSLVTANAHQDRYFHSELQSTVREMEGAIYEKLSEYLGTFARTELLTTGALQNSYSKIKESAEAINREYNYKCYLKAFSCLGDHVQYAFEPVEGDTITTITPSEHDAGYSLNYEARNTAAKLNQAVKTIRAFKKRIKACHHHKAKGLKHEPNDPSGPILDDKIIELENSIRNAETDKAKCEARLNKLREGGVAVDEYLDSISLDALEKESQAENAVQDWGSSSNGTSQMETPISEEPEKEAEEERAMANGEDEFAPAAAVDHAEGWGEVASQAANKAQELNQDSWAYQDGWAQEDGWAAEEQPAQPQPEAEEVKEIDPNAEVWKAIVLFPFSSQNEDELTVAENEEVDIMVKECDEEGWVMGRNKSGVRGYVPYNYIQVYDYVMKDDSPYTQQRSNSVSSSSGQVIRQPSVESTASWGHTAAPAMPSIPEQPPPQDSFDSSSEEEDSEDLPPGLAPPPGPPPQISILESEPVENKRHSRPISIQFGSSMDSEYCRALYDYEANGSDELSFREDEVIHIISRSPNGVEDGWWMGELDGHTGLFPSIVVEECQANGDDWSPDVSLASPTSTGPPCFSPPPLDAPPSLPPAPLPPSDPPGPPPPLPSQPGPPQPPLSSQPVPAPAPVAPNTVPAESSGLMLPQTKITITNPTPVVENVEEKNENTEETVSYHVEDTSFSLSMTSEKLEKYNSSVAPGTAAAAEAAAVQIEVSEEDAEEVRRKVRESGAQPPPENIRQENSSCLAFTEITVTAPTPRTQSPVEESISFLQAEVVEKEVITSEATDESRTAGEVESVSEQAAVAETSNSQVMTDKEPEPTDFGWANFQAEEEAKPSNSDWANFGPAEPESAKDVSREKQELPASILADLGDSEEDEVKEVKQVTEEVSNKEQGKKKVISDSSSESETEDGNDADEADSSATESGTAEEPNQSSGNPSPVKNSKIKLPPENFEPKQLKKLETMKESPA